MYVYFIHLHRQVHFYFMRVSVNGVASYELGGTRAAHKLGHKTLFLCSHVVTVRNDLNHTQRTIREEYVNPLSHAWDASQVSNIYHLFLIKS